MPCSLAVCASIAHMIGWLGTNGSRRPPKRSLSGMSRAGPTLVEATRVSTPESLCDAMDNLGRGRVESYGSELALLGRRCHRPRRRSGWACQARRIWRVCSVRAMEDFWNGLGDARGYVVGAAVTFLGVLINVLALWGLEAFRLRKQKAQTDLAWTRHQEQAQDTWDRERSARLEELRRETYTEIVAACEARAFLVAVPKDQQPEVLSRWRGSRATVRFVSDSRDLINAADALVDAAGGADVSKNQATRQAFIDARTEFVSQSRAELGRASLNIRTTTQGAAGGKP
jgi:hypothetical protein